MKGGLGVNGNGETISEAIAVSGWVKKIFAKLSPFWAFPEIGVVLTLKFPE